MSDDFATTRAPRFCRACGCALPAGAAFCVRCGEAVEGAAFCVRCGEAVEGAAADDAQPAQERDGATWERTSNAPESDTTAGGAGEDAGSRSREAARRAQAGLPDITSVVAPLGDAAPIVMRAPRADEGAAPHGAARGTARTAAPAQPAAWPAAADATVPLGTAAAAMPPAALDPVPPAPPAAPAGAAAPAPRADGGGADGRRHDGSAAARASAGKRARAAVLAVCAVAVCAAAAGGALYLHDQAQRQAQAEAEAAAERAEQEAWDAAHTPVACTLQLSFDGYDPANGSPVPLRITGTDADGAAVETAAYATSSELHLDLAPGSYRAEPAGMTVGDDGILHRALDATFAFAVDAQGVSPADATAFALAFETVPPERATDEQIDAVGAWLAEAGLSPETVASFTQAARAARQAAVDAAAAEQAARAAERERAEQAARNHVETDAFSFDIPEYWWGRVEWSTSTSTENGGVRTSVNIYVTGDDDEQFRRLAVIERYPLPADPAGEPWVADAGAVPVHEADADGMRLRVTALDPAAVYLVYGIENTPHLGELLDLGTGGRYTRDDLPQLSDPDTAVAIDEFFDAALVPTIELSRPQPM